MQATSALTPGIEAGKAGITPKQPRSSRKDGDFGAAMAGSARWLKAQAAAESQGQKNALTRTESEDCGSLAASYGYGLFLLTAQGQNDPQLLVESANLSPQIALCLEGIQPDTPGIQPLADGMGALLEQLEASTEQASLPQSLEMMARMPQITQQVSPDRLSHTMKAVETNMCPLESEDNLPPPQEPQAPSPTHVEGEPAPLLPPEAGQRASADAESDSSAADHGQSSPAVTDKAKAPFVTGHHQDLAPQTLELRAEQVAAAEQMQAQAPTASTTATKETLFDTMVESIAMNGGEADKTLSIQLRPDFLGKVSIELTLGEGGLHARIQADDHTVRNLLSSQVNSLLQSLTDKGVKVEAMEVIYTGVEQQFHQPQERGKEGFHQADRGKQSLRKIPSLAADGAEPPQEPDWDQEISSVEYRA